jgi:alkylhydroperoxidase/carboxymuconolactone decarboxylase family protein YurZ
MSQNPLDVFNKIDPEFLKHINNTREFALSSGALDKKYKFLIAMALDAVAGTTSGVKALAQAAMKVGATKEEIGETLRVSQYISGIGTSYTAAEALSDLF